AAAVLRRPVLMSVGAGEVAAVGGEIGQDFALGAGGFGAPDRSLGPRDEKRAWEAARPDNIAAAEARATNGNLTVSLRRADRCGGMRVDDWCLRTGRHQLGAAGQREGDG